MCFVLIVFHAHEQYPLIVAANRDEVRSRPTQSPHYWPGEPSLWAGRDEIAGGTWLGVNSAGLLAAVTNRPSEKLDGTLPSRGLLCLDVLRQSAPDAAATLVSDRLRAERFNPFNLLCANANEGWVSTWRGDMSRLVPGIHVLTNRGELDDLTLPVVQRTRDALNHTDLSTCTLDDITFTLRTICRDTRGPDPICRVGGLYGTVSSSIIAIGDDGTVAAYQHVEGPPSESSFSSLSLPKPPHQGMPRIESRIRENRSRCGENTPHAWLPTARSHDTEEEAQAELARITDVGEAFQ